MQIIECSAPGKVILFGEHAVVHGVTAIAVALSDLRLHTTIKYEFNDKNTISVNLNDLKDESGNSFNLSINLSSLKSLYILTKGL